jgi:serine/threonine protein kinase
MSLSPGTRVGTLEVISLLGTGGMGEVYRARDTRLKRDIAVKVLPAVWAADSDRVARFQREAELLATLNHPNVAAIYGVEEDGEIHAIVLELVEGPTLADRIAQGPLPLAEALPIAKQIADALDAAHERGIVHRDLKPANIKVREDGAVKVLDFGLAKAVEGKAEAREALTDSPTMTSPALTRHGVILGTAGYMSPEQARGKLVDKRTDIWAFGCVLYEMLTARAAFGGPTVSDTIVAILERHPDWAALPAATPPAVRHLLDRCFEKDRRRRLRDIGDARSDLDRVEFLAASPPLIERPGTRRWVWAGGMLVAAAATAALVWTRADARLPASSASFGPQFTRLTSDASLSTEPSLSRDGTLVVYASDRDGAGQLDLWLQRTTDGQQPLRLTDDPADDREPDVAPDGSVIVFRSDRAPGGVYVMPVLGGNARLVAPGGRAPRFSPDGRRIAYSVPQNWLAGARGTPSAMYVVAKTGGSATRIAQGLAIASSPLWSPDGRSLLFVGQTALSANDADWWWVPVDGGAPVATGAYRVIERAGLSGSRNDTDIAPAVWTKDGVLFSARLGDSFNIWRLRISERSGEPVETSLERLTFGVGSDVRPSVDERGEIAFQVASDVGESLTLALDPNSGRVAGTVTPRSFEAGQVVGRSSLDEGGRWLAYPRRQGTELWVKDLSSGRERHVLTAPAVANPIISHDGANVAFGDGEGARASGYVVPVADGTARKVCDGGCAIYGWFTDNRRILTFQWDDGVSKGRVRAVDTRDLKVVDLLETNARVGRLDLSPTERWLVFGSAGRTRMARVQPGSPPPEQEWVTVFEKAPGSAERPCGWSPDGSLLYLLLERDGFRDLYAQRIDAAAGTRVGEPFLVQHFHDPRRRWGSTSFGSAIVRNAFVFTQVESSGSIWLQAGYPGATSASRPGGLSRLSAWLTRAAPAAR